MSYKLGPGVLTVGDGIDQIAIDIRMTNGRIEWSEAVRGATDDADLLNGGVEKGDDGEATHSAVLAGNVFQDITADGIVAWSWTHRGETHPIVFQPNDAVERQVTGKVIVAPINLGGDVKTKPRSDFSWRFLREFPPVLGATA